jgi:hypothetical protein
LNVKVGSAPAPFDISVCAGSSIMDESYPFTSLIFGMPPVDWAYMFFNNLSPFNIGRDPNLLGFIICSLFIYI